MCVCVRHCAFRDVLALRVVLQLSGMREATHADTMMMLEELMADPEETVDEVIEGINMVGDGCALHTCRPETMQVHVLWLTA